MKRKGMMAIVPDAFSGKISKVAKSSGLSEDEERKVSEEQANVRRPLRGLVSGEDHYSVIRVVKENGQAVPIINSSVASTDTKAGYNSNFLIQSVQEQRSEKSQIIETFGENFVYFFGERPRIMSFSGFLVNSNDFNWKTEFWRNYEMFFRGTKLVELRARIYINVDDVLLEGYMLGASASTAAEDPHRVPFSFQMILTHYHYLRQITTKFPESPLEMPPINDYNGLKNYEMFNKSKSGSQSTLSKVLSTISGAIKSVTDGINSVINNFRTIAFGRQIRVPIGAAGSDALTNDFQLAQRGGTALNGGKIDRTNLLKGNRIALTRLPGTSNLVDTMGQIGLHTYDNYDEYPNGQLNLEAEKIGASGLAKYLEVTHVPPKDADEKVRDFFRSNGIDEIYISGLSDLQAAIASTAFGIASYAISTQIATGTGASVSYNPDAHYSNDGPVVAQRFVKQDHSKEKAVAPAIIPNPAR